MYKIPSWHSYWCSTEHIKRKKKVLQNSDSYPIFCIKKHTVKCHFANIFLMPKIPNIRGANELFETLESNNNKWQCKIEKKLVHCYCGTNNRAPRWTFTDPCKPEVSPGAREESDSSARLAVPAMNACDTTKVFLWRLDTGCRPTILID